MPVKYIHILLCLAVLLMQSCKATSFSRDVAESTRVDSSFVHVVDSHHIRSIFDSISFSLIHHDTTLRVERVFRDISQAAATIHDTAIVHHRDTLTVREVAHPSRSARDYFGLLCVWVLGAIIGCIVSAVWKRT